MSLYRSNACHPVVTVVELAAKQLGLDSGLVVQRVLNFYCTCSKMQRIMLNLRAER